MAPAILMRGVTFAYNGANVLDGVDLAIPEQEFVSVVGPNGGGKTTLLKLILGLLQPGEGYIRVLGRSPREARNEIGYVPQHAALDAQFPVNVMDVALMGRLNKTRQFGPYSRGDKQAACRALDEVGMCDYSDRPFAALSGGQRQRVLIARAIAPEPRLLLMDEPAANLDVSVEENLFELLRHLNRRMTIVLVSHDIGFVSKHIGRVVCVNRRVMTHPTSELNGTLIKKLYGEGMRIIRHDQSIEERYES
ncbi:MAG: ABC transporter ATP-binding protein [Acidobacteria bacterium]|nr:ABC transporter ATP-binding protein [Acidobacteriota bacterium]